MLTFTCLSTSRMPACLVAFFLPLSAWGNGGGMLFFIESSVINMCAGDSCHGRVSGINKICFLCSSYCRSQATAA